jgi:hypothetical protein
MKNMNKYSKEDQQISSSINSKRPLLGHTNKTVETQRQRGNFESSKKETARYIQGIITRLTVDFSSETRQVGRQ